MAKHGKKLSTLESVCISAFLWMAYLSATILVAITGLFVSVPITYLFDRSRKHIGHLIAQLWSKTILAFSFIWRLKVTGLEHIKPGQPYIIVANHQSMLDIAVALAAIPLHFKFLSKREVFSYPLIGIYLHLSGYIPLDRSDRQSGRAAILAAKEWLRKNISMLFFPEGTRSVDGEIKSFKTGAFKIAQDVQVPILPVVITGTRDAVPKKSWRTDRYSVFQVSIGKPVSVKKGDSDVVQSVKEKVRNEMCGRLDKLRKES